MSTGNLLIAHADKPYLTLMDATTLHPIREFDVPGRTAVLGHSSNGTYGFAIHRDDDCVTIIDPIKGIVQAIAGVGEQPTHFHAHQGHSLVFNDGSGSVTVFDERNLPSFVTHPVAQPDHGSAVLIGEHLVVGYLRAGKVEVYRLGEADVLQSFDCCPMQHGAAQWGDAALFGCSDGVLLMKSGADGFSATKLDNPEDTPKRVRVGLFATHEASPYVLGNFGQALMRIDPVKKLMHVLPLPAHPLRFCFDSDGTHILVLTTDGVLRRLTAEAETLNQLQVVNPVPPPKGPDGKTRPTFAISGESIYLIEPEQQCLIELSRITFTENRLVSLDFIPSAIVAFLK